MCEWRGLFPGRSSDALTSARARRARNSRAAVTSDMGGKAVRWISSTLKKSTPRRVIGSSWRAKVVDVACKPREAMKGDSVSSDNEVLNTVRVQQLDELFQIFLQLVQGMRGASVRVRVRYQVALEGSRRDKTRHRRARHPQKRCRPRELVPFGESSMASGLDPGLRWP